MKRSVNAFALYCAILIQLTFGQMDTHNITKKFHLNNILAENWFRAAHECQSRGMRLASILSKVENDQLRKQILETDLRTGYWTSGTKLGNGQNFYWFGLRRPMTYTNWGPGEPNNSFLVENCVETYQTDTHNMWNDHLCESNKYFVCEEDISPLPGTQSLHDLLSLRNANGD